MLPYLYQVSNNYIQFSKCYVACDSHTIGSHFRWAVDLIKEPITFIEAVPTSTPTKSDAPSQSTGPSLAPSTSLKPSSTPKPTPPPTPPPTNLPTVAPPCGVGCPAGATGNYPTFDCWGFFQCVSGASVASFACAPGTLFDDSIQVCNWASAVNCQCAATTPPPTPNPTPSATVPTPPPTPPPTSGPTVNAVCGDCSTSTLVASRDCSGFYYCTGSEPTWFTACGNGLKFNENLLVCDWEYNVACSCTSPTGELYIIFDLKFLISDFHFLMYLSILLPAPSPTGPAPTPTAPSVPTPASGTGPTGKNNFVPLNPSSFIGSLFLICIILFHHTF